jgi:hypothetical protein
MENYKVISFNLFGTDGTDEGSGFDYTTNIIVGNEFFNKFFTKFPENEYEEVLISDEDNILTNYLLHNKKYSATNFVRNVLLNCKIIDDTIKLYNSESINCDFEDGRDEIFIIPDYIQKLIIESCIIVDEDNHNLYL